MTKLTEKQLLQNLIGIARDYDHIPAVRQAINRGVEVFEKDAETISQARYELFEVFFGLINGGASDEDLEIGAIRRATRLDQWN